MSPRSAADRDAQAHELMRAGDEHMRAGSFAEAAAALERAAGLHAQAARAYDEARCLQMAAGMRRSAGDLEQARRLVEAAVALEPEDDQLAMSILAEQAEIAFASGATREAIDAWSRALERAPHARLGADATSALLRRRAAALLAGGCVGDATADFDEARRLLAAQHGSALAGFVRTEQAGLLWSGGHPDEVQRVVAQLERELGGEPDDPQLHAELLVARARLARHAGDVDGALAHACRARAVALEAVAPVTYLAACVEVAESLELLDLLADAYGALASALATLADAVGPDVARSWVQPPLLAAKLRWGAAAFEAAKAGYEERRRAQRGATS